MNQRGSTPPTGGRQEYCCYEEQRHGGRLGSGRGGIDADELNDPLGSALIARDQMKRTRNAGKGGRAREVAIALFREAIDQVRPPGDIVVFSQRDYILTRFEDWQYQQCVPTE